MADMTPLLFAALAFGAVTATMFVLGQRLTVHAQMERRLPASPRLGGEAGGRPRRGIYQLVGRIFPLARLENHRDQARRNLVRAGFFHHEAADIYLSARVIVAAAVPVATFVGTRFFPAGTPALMSVLLVTISLVVAVLVPGAFLSRRHRLLVRQYRLVFPDFLDLLVVCIDAGLTIDGAFGRVRGEIGKRSRALGLNLELMSAEMSAGRSMIEALMSLAERLALDEAASFASMLRQSIELGSDVRDALRVFSDEMREKRLLRAEEAANKLSVKMVLPLGLFIFPVVLLVVMLPVLIKLLTVLK
jgi:tight adherence protein C